MSILHNIFSSNPGDLFNAVFGLLAAIVVGAGLFALMALIEMVLSYWLEQRRINRELMRLRVLFQWRDYSHINRGKRGRH